MQTKRIQRRIEAEEHEVFQAGMRVGAWSVQNAKAVTIRERERYFDCRRLFEETTRAIATSAGQAFERAVREGTRDAYARAHVKTAAKEWMVERYGNYLPTAVQRILDRAFASGMAEGRIQEMHKKGC